VESDCLGFNLAVFYIDFVPTQNDRDILADTDEIAYNKQGLAKEGHDGGVEGRVRCQLGTFLYVMRDVTSNMMIPH